MKSRGLPTGSEVEARLTNDPGFEWDGIVGGEVPVVVEFIVDGFFGYFRARGGGWSLVISRVQDFDPADASVVIFKIESLFGDWPDAGYMALEQALRFVENSISVFRKLQPTLPKQLGTDL
jgi:hypothetical protein